MNPFQGIEPDWAWAAYRPKRWTPRAAAHLQRRAGFGVTADDTTDTPLAASPQAAIDHLFRPRVEAFEAEMQAMVPAVTSGNDPHKLASWWLYKMRHTPTPLREKMTLFWHGHFATSAAKVREADLMLQQHLLLAEHALGSFRDLALGISRDSAMLMYLDATENRKARPNENYAREFMELFCLGEGAYGEADIKELARCFTGWDVRFGRAKFTALHHDRGVKHLLGRSGRFDDEGAVDAVLADPSCSKWIARKLVRFFVADVALEDIPERLVTPLAQRFADSEFRVEPVVRMILGSQLFYSKQVIGQKVKSPTDFAIGILRSIGAATNFTELERELGRLGQSPFYPPSVKGWSGGLDWINASTLLGRSNLAARLAKGQDVPELAVLEERLLARPLPVAVRASLLSLSAPAALHALSAQPEFHLA